MVNQVGGQPKLNQVILQPAFAPNGSPLITTNGGDLIIASATGRVIVQGELVATLSSIAPGGGGGGNVFPSGITVMGGATISGGMNVTGLANFNSGIDVSGGINIITGGLISAGNAQIGTGTGNPFVIISGGSTPSIGATHGSISNSDLIVTSHGTGNILMSTQDGASDQVAITHTASPAFQLILTGGSSPTVSSNGGDLLLLPFTTIVQIGQNFSSASIPAAFSGSLIWTIKDQAGNTRYVPISTAPW